MSFVTLFSETNTVEVGITFTTLSIKEFINIIVIFHRTYIYIYPRHVVAVVTFGY